MSAPTSWRTFLRWAAAAAALGLLALLIGAGGLLLLLVLGFVAWTREDRPASLSGVLAGSSLLAFALGAWISTGPDRLCAPYSLGALVSCASVWGTWQTAWPWFVFGAVLLGGGLLVRRRGHEADPTRATPPDVPAVG